MLGEDLTHFLEVGIRLSAHNLLVNTAEVRMVTLTAREHEVTIVSSDISHTIEAKHPPVADIVELPAGFGSIGACINPVSLQQASGVVALVLHNHIVQYAARADDVLNASEVIHTQWELQDPKALLENAKHPLYYFAHRLASARIKQRS